MDKNYNIYLGIVVQNNDPEMRGRIKVYIPQLAPTINNLNTNVDKFFAFIGKETQNLELNKVLEDLKNSLPWAEYAGPICGGNASGRYNAFTENGTTSDSNSWDSNKVSDGFRPAQNFVSYQIYPDAFTSVDIHKNKFTNEYAYQYTPANYSGLARGLFSIPNVGAHVYVFFINGDRNFPVYFASAYSQEDIKRIYTLHQDVNENGCVDYPASYENIKKTALDSDVKTFRSKTVLNSNKHTLEFIDTDLKEIVRLTHYSGSFKEFNNKATIELASNNDQKMVIGDQFLTVQKNKSEYIRVHNEQIVVGDQYINIGESDQSIIKEILNLHKQIHEEKLLFDVQRALYGEKSEYINFSSDMSPLQKRSGLTGNKLGKKYKKGFIQCPICKNLPYDPYDISYGMSTYDMWKEAPLFMPSSCLKSGSTVTPTVDPGSPSTLPSLGGVTKLAGLDKLPGLDQLPGMEEGSDSSMSSTYGDSSSAFGPVCHVIISEEFPAAEGMCYITPEKHRFEGKLGYYKGMKCACCEGTGFSPSTESGIFDLEPAKKADGSLEQKILSLSPQMFKLEKQLGEGGDQIITVSMNKIETIGLAMNDLKSFRVDPIGKLKIDGCHVAPQGVYENFKPSPHVEYVDVSDIPGGDYVLTCMNKYKLLVGSKGLNIQTSGPIDIYGSIVNFTAEQLNISSKNEIIIDGGERTTLRGRKITLLPVEHNAVVVEGQLHVTRNSIIQGGMMIEGEIGLLHITAPIEWQETKKGLWEDQANCSIPVKITLAAQTEQSGGTTHPHMIAWNEQDAYIKIPDHSHWFKNIPLTLLPAQEAVREIMISKGINSRTRIVAASPSSNPSTCSPELWEKAAPEYTKVAWEKAKENANITTEWKQWDASYKSGYPIAGGPMRHEAGRNTCIVNGEVTTLTATFFWQREDNSGIITVTSVMKEDGEFLTQPKAS